MPVCLEGGESPPPKRGIGVNSSRQSRKARECRRPPSRSRVSRRSRASLAPRHQHRHHHLHQHHPQHRPQRPHRHQHLHRHQRPHRSWRPRLSRRRRRSTRVPQVSQFVISGPSATARTRSTLHSTTIRPTIHFSSRTPPALRRRQLLGCWANSSRGYQGPDARQAAGAHVRVGRRR